MAKAQVLSFSGFKSQLSDVPAVLIFALNDFVFISTLLD